MTAQRVPEHGRADKSGALVGVELDQLVHDWRTRPIDVACPYVWLDAKYIHVREGGRVVSRPVVVAHAVREDGYRTEAIEAYLARKRETLGSNTP